MREFLLKEVCEAQPKNLIDFQHANKKPLILYGMGKVGEKAYKRIKSMGIHISALVDGDPHKQHTFIDEYEICSLDEAISKYGDAVYCITVSKPDLWESIIDTLCKKGANKNIIVYFPEMLNNPKLPFYIIGDNELARKMRDLLIENGGKFKGYVTVNSEPILNADRDNVYSLEEVLKNKEDVNFLLCDKKNEEKFSYYLEQNNKLNHAYGFYSPVFGLFKPNKYEFLNAMTRKLLYPYLCCLNKFYYCFSDNDSQFLFRKICSEFFSRKKCLTTDEYMKILSKLKEWRDCELIGNTMEFIGVSQDITEFLRFMIMLDKVIFKQKHCSYIIHEAGKEHILLTFGG